jgi:hypothetical protein
VLLECRRPQEDREIVADALQRPNLDPLCRGRLEQKQRSSIERSA